MEMKEKIEDVNHELKIEQVDEKDVNKVETIEEKNGMLFVYKTVKKDGKEVKDNKSEMIAITRFVTKPAYVSVSRGMTIPLKDNYGSIRLDVSVTIPCYKEEIDEAYYYLKKFCEDKFNESYMEVMKALGG